jgi:hypothetical protein
VAGSTVAVSNWSIYTLPPRNLEAVLAHELAHHLALPRLVSLFIYWLSLPARVMGLVIAGGLKHPVLSMPVKLVLGFLTVGVFLVGFFTEFDWYTVLMLSPWTAPLVVPWLARKAEQHADRVAADLGFGVQLVEVFAGREFDANPAGPARVGNRHRRLRPTAGMVSGCDTWPRIFPAAAIRSPLPVPRLVDRSHPGYPRPRRPCRAGRRQHRRVPVRLRRSPTTLDNDTMPPVPTTHIGMF